MSVGVLTAVGHELEADLVTRLEEAPGIEVVRRCADLAELLAVAAAGVGDLAVVSPDLRGLDRDALRHLAGQGVHTAGLAAGHDEPGEARLRQLGVTTVIRPDASPAELSDVLVTLHEGPRDRGREQRTGPTYHPGWRAPGALADGVDVDEALGDVERLEPDITSRGRVLAVWGPTGAPGRTTVAVTVAAVLAESGHRVLLVDLDTWGASIGQALGLLDEAPGVAAAARAAEQGALDVLALARISPEVSRHLRVLTGIPKPERWPELRAAAVENVLQVARLLVDHIVVDCGFSLEDDEELSYDTAAPRRNAATLTCLEQADAALVVGSADPVGLQRLVRAVQDLAVVQGPTPVVVVNKVRESVAGRQPHRSISDVLGRFAGLEQLTFLPWDPDACDAAMLEGRTLPEQVPTAPLTTAVRALAAGMLGEVSAGGESTGRAVGRHGARTQEVSRRRAFLRR